MCSIDTNALLAAEFEENRKEFVKFASWLMEGLPNISMKSPDIVQEVFTDILNGIQGQQLRVYVPCPSTTRHLRNAKTGAYGKASTFIHGRIRWKILDSNKKINGRRRKNNAREIPFSNDKLPDNPVLPERKQNNRLDALEHCMEQLSVEEIKLIKLLFLQLASYSEIATILTEKESEIKRRFKKLKKKLENCIENQMQQQ